jgi:hypothetical protein
VFDRLRYGRQYNTEAIKVNMARQIMGIDEGIGMEL